MPDYSFISQPQVPDSFRRIGEMIDFARGATELQKSRATMEADIARAQAESSRQQTAASVEAQTAAPRVAQQEAKTAQSQTEAKGAAFKLSGEQNDAAMKMAGGYLQDPRITGPNADEKSVMEVGREIYSNLRAKGVPEDTADFWASQLKAKAHDPAGAAQLLRNVTRANAGSGTQAGVINAPLTPVQTQAGTKFLQTQPGAQNAIPAGANLPVGVSPVQSEQPATDALGRPVIAKRDQAGALSFGPPPGSNYKPLMTLPAGETPDTAKPLLALRDNAQAAAAAAPNQHFNNQQILKLADSAFTGTGSQEFSRLLNSVGLQKVTGDAAKDTAQLQHFIALQIENNAAAQGANTDAARQLAAQAVLPGNTPAQTIKAITKINDAYSTGTELFNRGIQATLGNPNNAKDVFAIRDFQNAWTANMDPRIFQLENAVKAGDKAEVAKIKDQLGAAGIKQLATKARNLQSLIHQGAVGGP